MDGRVWEASKVVEALDQSPQQLHKVMSRPGLVIGIMRVRPGGLDTQGTHDMDELYTVVSGHGLLRLGDVDHPVGPGTVAYVPRGLPHRFHGNKELLTMAYVMVPSERA